MESILILLFCGVLALAVTAVFVAVLATGLKRRNSRAHKLGRLLLCSHPEWN
jgi:hypothetical protein